MNIAASVFVTILLSGFVAAWIERPLPWNPKEKRPDKKETFVKFWKRAVLETLIRIDYDEWFKNFHPTKYSLASSFGEKFTCPPLKTKQPPISIHRITPADIKVVAAIGDQITAAFGAKASNLRNLFVEYRGISWSIGGKGNIQTAATIPNILKKYNPFVYGYSTGMTAVDNLKEKKAGFSSAESGKDKSVILGELVFGVHLFSHGGLRSMPNPATNSQLNVWQNCPRILGFGKHC